MATTVTTAPRRTRRIAVITGVLTLVGGGIAFAYWTQGGTGSGTAATGSTVAITVNQTSTVTAMGPGVAAQPLSGNFDNTNSGPVYVTTVTVSIGSITGGGPTCEATDYTLANAVSDVNAEIPVGTGVGSWGTTDTPTIAFNNKTTENQDDCKNAVVNLVYTAA